MDQSSSTAKRSSAETTAATRELVERVFGHLGDASFNEKFRATLSDDLIFTATGSSPVAGRYTSKADYIEKVLGRLHERLATPVQLSLEQAFVDGEWACVRFRSEGVRGINGTDFSMQYCWVLRVQESKITEITGFYDTKKMVDLFA